MNSLTIKVRGLCAAVVMLVGLVGLEAATAQAVAMPSDTLASFTGTVQHVPADTYDVYVRLAQRGQTAQVAVEVQSGQSSEYSPLGSLVATSSHWQKIGAWQALRAGDEASFRLNSDQLSTVVDANRPALLLISRSHPVCEPNPECAVTVDGREGVVLPPSNSALRDTLRISRVVPPANDTVSKVVRYLDNKPIYSTKSYQPLDFRYVLHDRQVAVSVIEYTSGQRIIINEPIPDGYTDTLWNFIFRGFQQNAQLYMSLLVIVGIVILLFIALGVVRIIERRHAWRIAHGFIVIKQHALSSRELRRGRLLTTMRSWLKRVLAACFVALTVYSLFVLASTYIITVARVDGVSMEDTYTNGSALLVNRVPITLAQLAGRNYVPTRGQVVILHAVYGITDSQTSSKDGQEYIVKRVLGLPGERVVVDRGVVTVYASGDTTIYPDRNAAWSSTMHVVTDNEHVDLTLGNDEVFVSGDNRPLSMDSRINGAISTSQITGVVITKL